VTLAIQLNTQSQLSSLKMLVPYSFLSHDSIVCYEIGTPFDAGYYRLFFNINSDPASGLAMTGLAFRSSFMLHGSAVYDQRGGSWSDVSLSFVPQISRSVDGLDVELKFSRAWTFADSSLMFPAGTIKVQTGITDTSWTMQEFSPELDYIMHTVQPSIVQYEHDIGHDLRTWSAEKGAVAVSGVIFPPEDFSVSGGSVQGVSISLLFPDASGSLKNNIRSRIQLHPSAVSVWNAAQGLNTIAAGVAVTPSDKFHTKHPYPINNYHTSVTYVGTNCLKVYFTDKTCTALDRDTMTITHAGGNFIYSGCTDDRWPRMRSPLLIPSGHFASHFYAKLSERDLFGYAMVVSACANSTTPLPAGNDLGTLSKFIDVSQRSSDHKLFRVVWAEGSEEECLMLFFTNATRMRSDKDYISIFKDTSMKSGTWGRKRYRKKHSDWPTENDPLRVNASSVFVKYRAVYSKTPADISDPVGSWGYDLKVKKC
jgi:hypothetical protein